MKETAMIYKNILSAMLYVALLLAVVSCGKDDNGGGKKDEDSTTIRRTVLVYVSAQNSLGYQQFNKGDSTEMIVGSQFMNARDQLLLYVDDAQKPRVYRIYKGCKQPQLVRRYGSDVNSSDAGVLKELLQWMKGTYPSESYGLVMWSHSDGWVPSWSKDYSQVKRKSFGLDVGEGGNMEYDLNRNNFYGSTMDIDDMAQAIEESGVHPKFIFFDSCLMQCIEVDYALRHATDYVIASPISTPAIGQNYTTLVRDGLFKDDVSQIAASYYNYIVSLPLNNVYSDFGMVISCVRTSELENLAAATRKCISEIKAYEVAADNDTVYNWIPMDGVTQYELYAYKYFYRPHFYDFACAMNKMLSPESYAEWRKALDKCMVYYNGTERFFVESDSKGNSKFLTVDLLHYCAISAFVPQQIYSQNAASCIFGDLNKCFRRTEWYEDAGWEDAGW